MPDLGAPALAYLAVFVLFIPWIALKSKRHLDAGKPAPPRAARIRSVLVFQGLMIGLGLLLERQWELRLLPPPGFTGRQLLIALGLFALLAASIPWRWRSLPEGERRRATLLMPRSGRDVPAWVLISCLAGFGEELNYRGVLVAVLTAATGNWWIAVAVSIAAFSLAHAAQSWRKAGMVAAFSVVFQAAVVLAGSLLPAMLAHAAYDIVAGLVFGRLARNLPEPPAPSAAATPPLSRP
jgi:membrane protease YdiL (CAAX protease family)